MLVNPFAASPGSGQSISTTGSSQAIAVSAVDPTVCVSNYGATNAAYVRIGTGACTAADQVVRANSERFFLKGDGITAISVLQLTGATTLHISTGNGGL
jgi:hypothetical protein